MFYVLLCVSYLLGALSPARLLSHLFHLPDPSQHGSHNPGTTNVLRLSGKKFAALTFAADVLKGSVAVLLGAIVALPATEWYWLGFAAIMGHIHPIYYRFQGGKGVATTLGVVMALNPLLAGIMLLIWALVAFVSRLSSLAAIFSIAATCIASLWIDAEQAGFYLLLWLTIVATHQDNIRRLLIGKETPFKL